MRVYIVHTLCHLVFIATPTEDQRSMANVSKYLATLVPMRAAKAKAALERQVRVNGCEFLTRVALVERCLTQGYRVTLRRNGERVLMSLDGSWFDAANITTTGLDYAAFLQERSQGPT